MTQYLCPKTNKIHTLPPNLALHQRKVHGKWRYKGPDGRRTLQYYTGAINGVDSNYIDPEVAIDAAHALNQKYYQIQAKIIPAEGMEKTLLEQHMDDFIFEFERENINKKDNGGWANNQLAIKAFVRDFKEMNPAHIDAVILKDWLKGTGSFSHYERSYWSQKHHFFGMTNFFDHLLLVGFIKSVAFNPFRYKGNGSFKLPEIPQKTRTRLEFDQYTTMLHAAINDGCDWFVLAMKLGLSTKLRIQDLVDLKFDQWDQDLNCLYRNITKSENQKGLATGQINFWQLDDHPYLLGLLKQASATRDNVATNNPDFVSRAEHILHRKPSKVRASKTKDHYSQLSKRDIQDAFAKYRDLIPEIRDLPIEQKPTFHELRSLAGRLEIQQGISLEAVSKSLAHSGVDVTKNKYLNDNKARLEVIGYSLPLEKLLEA